MIKAFGRTFSKNDGWLAGMLVVCTSADYCDWLTVGRVYELKACSTDVYDYSLRFVADDGGDDWGRFAEFQLFTKSDLEDFM